MGKTIINESVLRKIIAESLKEVLNERSVDWIGSGLVDYQGTGSKESKDRMEKIRKKSLGYNGGYEPRHTSPGKRYTKKNGEYGRNKSTFEDTWGKFGVGGKSGQEALSGRFNIILKGVDEFIDKIRAYNDENLNSLAKKLDDALWEWNNEILKYRDKKGKPQE